MNPIAEDLIAGANSAANAPVAKMAGVSSALRLLVSWVFSIEGRLERLEDNENGNS